MLKYASFRVLSAHMAPTAPGQMRRFKQAHRATFEYEPRPGFLYVRSRAISSRCNDNFDEFPAEEIERGYRSFIGKPVFVNHHNDNHRRMRGVIVDAALHKDANPDGSPDTWCEVLMEVDAIKFPKLAEAIVKGHIDRTSMGCDVAYSLCSFCGNKAATPLDYCQHIPRLKGKKIRRVTASGEREDVLVREICYGLKFFENSLLVEDPADPTAYFLGVDTRGLDAVGQRHAVRRDQGRVSADRPRPRSRAVVDPAPTSRTAGLKRTAETYLVKWKGKNLRFENTTNGWGFVVVGEVDGQPTVLWQGVDSAEGMRVLREEAQKACLRGDVQPVLCHVQDLKRAPQRRASRHLAFGETIAPPKIDTLRDANCPVCGEADAYNGIECMVCGFVKPPDMFMDPNVEVAQQNDLRQDQQAQQPAGGYVPPQSNSGGASGYVPPAANGQQDPSAYVPPTVEDDPEDEDEEEPTDDKKRPVKKSQRILAGV